MNLAVFTSPAFAQTTSGITYQGRIVRPDGRSLEDSAVQFKLQIRTPDGGNCLMFEEIQTLDMKESNGLFSLTINNGDGVRTDAAAYAMDTILANRGSFTFDPRFCTSGNNYVPNANDGRKLVVSFKDSTMSSWEQIPAQKINFIPLAIEAKQVGGFRASNLLRFAEADGTLVNTSPLGNTEYNELLALLNGTSTSYEKAGRLNGVAVPTLNAGDVLRWSGSAWSAGDPLAGVQAFAKTALPICGVNEFLKDDGSGLFICEGVSGSSGGTVTQVNTGTGLTGGGFTTSGTISIAAGGVSATELATDAVTSVKILDGPITASDLAADIALTTTGAVIATNISSAISATRELQLVDPGDLTASAKRIKLKAPLALAADYTLIWPFDDGANGQVLSTDGSGNLSWATAATAGGDFMKDGSVAMTGEIELPVGSVGAPSLGFTGDTATGIYRFTAGVVGFSSNGISSMTVGGANGVEVNSILQVNGQVSSASSNATIYAATSSADVTPNLSSKAGTIQVYNPSSAGNGKGAFYLSRVINSSSLGQNAYFGAVSVTGAANYTPHIVIGQQTGASSYAERMRIDNAGNVGIGTTTPSRLLHIAGPVRVTASAAPTSPGAGDIYVDSTDGNKLKWHNGTAWQTVGTGGATSPGGANYQIQFNSSGAFSGSTSLTWDGNALGIISGTEGTYLYKNGTIESSTASGGKIQVGTTSSGAPAGTALGEFRFSNSINSTAAKIVGLSAETQAFGKSGGAIAFQTTLAGSTTQYERMRITDSGKIGIGTTTPNRLLEVAGSIRVTASAVPTSPAAGDIYVDSTDGNKLKWHNGTAWQTVTSGGVGLTNFVDSVNASAPNGTIRVAQFAPSSTNTDVDISITPKGTGALLIQTPDGTDAQGDKRGPYAVDFQRVRSASTQVASGYYSALIGGLSNEVSGFASGNFAGQNSTTSGDYSAVIAGDSNAATFAYSATLGGYKIRAEQNYATAVGGQENIAGGASSFIGGGDSHEVSAQRSAIVGGSSTTISGQNSGSLGGSNHDISAQYSAAIGGYGATISADYSAVVGGSEGTAAGYYSTVIGGYGNVATGSYSLAAGNGTTAHSYGQAVFGSNNQAKGGEDPFNWVETDPLFVVGNGLDATTKSNALVILKNGNVGIGTTSPRAGLDVQSTIIGSATENSTTVIDASTGNMQYTTLSCTAFALHNLKSGGVYMFVVQGTTSATCSFTAFSDAGTLPLTVHMPPGHAATTAGKHTIYNVAVVGTHAYVSWIPGY
ncbi:MAG TPA: hypothetical protein VM432_03575 [Bdellovibrionales bacterium]|nr:hypothetical protein [Bdellovibrionales bacterium]